jgi:hypothetical protein
MEQEQTPTTPSTENAFPTQQNNNKNMTPLVSVVVIVLLLAGTAAYMLSDKPDASLPTDTIEFVATTPENGGSTTDALAAEQEAAAAALSTQGTSDEISAIEQDLNATNLDVVSTYIDQI